MFKITKPVTPSQRHLIRINQKSLTKKPLIKTKLRGSINSAGRNNTGKITVRHKGGGHKRKYRTIDFLRTEESEGIICSIEYDPNRTAHIAGIYDFIKNKFFYILAPNDLKIGDIVKSGKKAEIKTGHSLPLGKIPVGSYIHNVSLKKNTPGKFSRSAGSFSKINEKTLDFAEIEFNSGKKCYVSTNCFATIGIVSNDAKFLTQLGKAGHARWLNKRPTVRGVAMNPVDHPHGGGEGKKSGKGRTPWGKPSKPGKNRKK